MCVECLIEHKWSGSFWSCFYKFPLLAGVLMRVYGWAVLVGVCVCVYARVVVY